MNGSAVSGHDALGRFTAGHSEWKARKQHIAEIAAQLASEYDTPSPVTRRLLHLAATHLYDAQSTRNAIKRQRATNCAERILGRLSPRPANSRGISASFSLGDGQ